MSYHAEYTSLFSSNLTRYAGLRSHVLRVVNRVLENPYHNTERLGYRPGQINLRGCRSARIDRNFRLVFVICEGCRPVPQCEYCFCEGLPDKTVVFFTIGPHQRAYAMRESEAEYNQSGATHLRKPTRRSPQYAGESTVDEGRLPRPGDAFR